MEGCADMYTLHCFIYFPGSVIVALWGSDQKTELWIIPCKGQRVVGHRVHTAGTAAASWGTPNLPCREDCCDVPLRTMTSNQKTSLLQMNHLNSLQGLKTLWRWSCFYKNCKFLLLTDLPPRLIIHPPPLPNLSWLKRMLIFSAVFLLSFHLNVGLIQFSPIKQTHSLENREPPHPALLLKPDLLDTVLTLQENPC